MPVTTLVMRQRVVTGPWLLPDLICENAREQSRAGNNERAAARGRACRPHPSPRRGYPSSLMRYSAKRRAASGSVAELRQPSVMVRRGSSRMGRTTTPDSKPTSIIS